MPLSLGKGTAVLSGSVTVEEAEPLAEWLRRTGSPRVSMKDCEYLHTAVLQLLLAAHARVTGPPNDPFLVSHVLPLLRPATLRPDPLRPAPLRPAPLRPAPLESDLPAPGLPD